MNKIVNKLLKLPITLKYFILFINDIFIIIFSLWSSFSLRLSYFYNPFNGSASIREWLPNFISNYSIYSKLFDVVFIFLLTPLIFIPISIYFGLWTTVIRFIGLKGVTSIVKTTFLYSLILGFIIFTLKFESIPRSILIINFFISCALIIFSRYLMRYLSRKADYNFVFFNKSKKNKKAVIIGANQNGRILAESIFELQNYSVYCFFDEDKKVIGRKIFDLQVFDLDDLEKIVEKQHITDVFLSISINNQQFRKKVIKSLSGISVRVQSIPNFFETIGGNLNFEDLQELDINDILGRDLVHLNQGQLNQKLSNKSILITGAGGSIGSELCKQIIIYKPRKLIIFEQSEYSLYEIHKILQSLLERISANISKVDFNNSLKLEIIPILGSVQDYKLLDDILKFYKPEIVYHAAAYKHVPLVERNVSEGIKNNIFGSLNIALASIKNNVEDFVLVSTDKAVRPTNIMGASKRFAELILQALSNQKLITYNNDKFILKEIENNTNFCIVRFGNVLGSSGSVFPLFKKQIKDGGPLTLTDLNVTRYFMSIDEATKLVIQSSCMNTKKDICEIYVLHMGDPVKIYDLAKKMIRYSGLTIKDESDLGGDIEIKLIGLRPGEKLFEELLIGNNSIKTKHEKIFKAREDFIEWKKLKIHLFNLNNFIDTNDENKIFKTLKQTVVGFNPD